MVKVGRICYERTAMIQIANDGVKKKGLSALGWTIEDIEESVGLPRGWTDVPYQSNDKTFQRLRLLQRQFGGDGMMEQYFVKYGLPPSSRRLD